MLRGSMIGWTPEPESDPVALLILLVIRQALEDLDKEADAYHCVDPVAARAFLLDDAPGLLAALDLEEYAEQLLAMIGDTPEPVAYQTRFWEEVA